MSAQHVTDGCVSLVCRYKRLRLVGDCLSSWEEKGQRVPLEELLGSTLQNIRAANGWFLAQSALKRVDSCLNFLLP